MRSARKFLCGPVVVATLLALTLGAAFAIDVRPGDQFLMTTPFDGSIVGVGLAFDGEVEFSLADEFEGFAVLTIRFGSGTTSAYDVEVSDGEVAFITGPEGFTTLEEWLAALDVELTMSDEHDADFEAAADALNRAWVNSSGNEGLCEAARAVGIALWDDDADEAIECDPASGDRDEARDLGGERDDGAED